ncbi:nucleoside recognition domain-containing protein [Anaerolentibacter hominis]|uniref:nucleoside recognition domain-containing protein n=1 Tax=Anaerolentibacter hominis TaxID=3079009 RepID=UPI0031B88536
MLNYIWAGMILIGVVLGVLQGNGEVIGTQALTSAKEAVSLCVTMLGVMTLWSGLMEVAREGGLIKALVKVLSPLITLLFPDIPRDHVAREYIASNFVANFLGLGWAATPLGLKAMKELKKLNRDSERASCDMCTFLIMNISSLQLIPINIIAYRSQYGSVKPTAILGAAIVATCISTLAGILFAVIARKVSRD